MAMIRFRLLEKSSPSAAVQSIVTSLGEEETEPAEVRAMPPRVFLGGGGGFGAWCGLGEAGEVTPRRRSVRTGSRSGSGRWVRRLLLASE